MPYVQPSNTTGFTSSQISLANNRGFAVRMTDNLVDEYATIKLGVNLCKSATFLLPEKHVWQYGDVAFVIDGAKALETRALSAVGPQVMNPSNPLQRTCGMRSEFHSTLPTQKNLENAFKKTLNHALKTKGIVHSELKIDLTDDLILGVIVNPRAVSWNTIVGIMHGGEEMAAKFGGTNKLKNVFYINPTNHKVESIGSELEYEHVRAKLIRAKPRVT